ncbi:MAG: ketoacyl-ACP synthase III [Acholeplasmataceae bacterium]|nr:ketoacyl-ACP synthase III [Acholeplasmataceae bacterium]
MMHDIKVLAAGKYVPDRVVTNDDLAKTVDTSDAWIESRTGIKERRIASIETSADLAYRAALDAIDRYQIDKDLIDLVIVATITEPQKTPSTANMVQGMLGLSHEVMSFDINAACTGFIYALEVASSLLINNRFRHALVIGSEKLSSVVDHTDRNTCVLFGDGAGAMIIAKDHDQSSDACFYNAARHDHEDALVVKDVIQMDGRKVYQFAVGIMEQSIRRILDDSGMVMDDIDLIVPHQANIRIIESVAKSMDLPIEKFMINIRHYGNTSAASIPITLAELMAGVKHVMKRVLLVGFGGGFTWGSAILTIGGTR